MASRKLEFELEKRIVNAAVHGLLKAGYSVEPISQNEPLLIPTRNQQAIATKFQDEPEWLRVYRGPEQVGWVRLVWGNVQDIISDYTVNLEGALSDANKLAATYSD